MIDLAEIHKNEYGCKPEVVGSAPGVLNILGEHTDYNEGYVLQMALPQRSYVALSRRKDNSLRFYSHNLLERKRTTIPNLKFKKEDRWANLCKGVLAGFMEEGHSFKGLDITIYSEVPPRIGLGSSTSICAAAAAALNGLFSLKFKNLDLIKIVSDAEIVFMGLARTLSDAFTACIAKPGKLFFLDLRNLDYGHLPLDLSGRAFLVTNSNVPIIAEEADLIEFRENCQRCVDYLNRKRPGRTLRDYSSRDLKFGMGLMPENSRRLCLHVLSENERVLEAQEAVKNGDLAALGKLMFRSHESLRDNYEVSCPELDWLVKRAGETEGVLGARMTGCGFGGCTVTLLNQGAAETFEKRLEEYEHIFGFVVEKFYCQPGGGVEVKDNG
ncbi:MAG: galactokinase [Spirochaetales bacterium]|jgi:galactokinase|nr:galactokinase [Spirochaetales bacterium]